MRIPFRRPADAAYGKRKSAVCGRRLAGRLDMDRLQLKIITPQGSGEPIDCDSVRLTVRDGQKGRGGGSYGIRRGHAQAFFSLDAGGLTASLEGKPVFQGRTGRGFATVRDDLVTVVSEEFVALQR